MSACIFIIFALPHYKKDFKAACTFPLIWERRRGLVDPKRVGKTGSSLGSRKRAVNTVSCLIFWDRPHLTRLPGSRCREVSVTHARPSSSGKSSYSRF